MPHDSARNAKLSRSRCARLLSRSLLSFLSLILLSCGSVPSVTSRQGPPDLEVISRSFGPRPDIISPQQIHSLSEEQKQAFLSYYHDPVRATQPGSRRMVRYIDVIAPDFEYMSDTHTASQAIEFQGGNCLTLAILTTAFAQLAGLEYDFQLMEDQPVYAINDDTIQKGVHIRSRVMNPDRPPGNLSFFIPRGITIDYFSNRRERFIRNLEEGEYLAMYYRNMAVEALEGNDLNEAYWYTHESLRYAPASSESLNMLAVVTRRAGHADTAEQIYRYAITHASEKLSLLKNYRLLLVQAGRRREAALIDWQLHQGMDDPSPYNWYHLAQSSALDGDHRRAIRYYQRTLGLAPYLHEAYFGMAKSYHALADLDSADAAMRAAIAATGRASTRRLYKAKLTTLINN